jgi:hypothetical protein
MIRDVDRRLARLERITRPSGTSAPRLIIIRGGLPAAPEHEGMYAESNGGFLESWPGESLASFEVRAVDWAHEIGADTVIIAGVFVRPD